MPDVTPATRAPNQSIVSRVLRFVWYTFLILVGIAIAVSLLTPSLYTPPEVHRRRQCKNNLKEIGLALHNYYDKYACFPPAFIADAQGRPMHSWRVLLLPFLQRSDLYEQYHFDEPWDGPNNRRLHDAIVPVFNCPSETHSVTDQKSTSTNYVAVIGPETAWPGASSARFSDIKDGTSTTLLVVETANSGIHWMEPRDFHMLQMATRINAHSGQGTGSRHTEGAHVLFADGTVRFLRNDIPAVTLRALITAHAGDEPGNF